MPSTRTINKVCTSKLFLSAALAALLLFQPVAQAASSLPTGGTFSAGSGKIYTSGNLLTITQSSLNGIINWNTFSVGKESTVSFRNGSGATLNLVTGHTPSTVLGQLLATGSIYLLNTEGVLISRGATVRTGGDFVASTLTLPAAQFLSTAPLLFSGSSAATVVNLGSIGSSGGNIYLIGRSVQNAGSISSPNGTAGLAAGSQVLIANSSNGQRVAIQAPGGDVHNTGFINAAQVELKSNGGNIYALAGNNGGRINATGTANINGHAWLIATNGTTNVSGAITATNSNGQGGAVETSGARVNADNAHISTGKGGSWLLDPDDLTINSGLASTIESSLNGGTTVTEQTTAAGTGGNGDIFVNSPIAWTTAADLTLSAFRNIQLNAGISNTGAGNLMLRADSTSTGTGTIGGSGVINFSGGTGYVSLLYNPSSYASPTNYAAHFGSVNGAWTAPANHSVSNQYTAYMLVNSAANLQNLDTNDSGTYALGKDIDLSSVPNFSPLGQVNPFGGILDGIGHTISGLTITSTPAETGLFSIISPLGQARNVNLTNVSIAGNSLSYYTGVVAGTNHGVISNVAASGTVNATNTEYLGGLVSVNDGTIQNSSSTLAFNLNGATYLYLVGGIAGYNSGPIVNSYATGSIAYSGNNTYLGGLAGESAAGGTISNSHATGSISAGGSAQAGGLVGASVASISNSYATGAISANASTSTGGLTGTSSAPISDSWATGSVNTSGSTIYAGGLVGNNQTGSVITNSYATGNVTGGAHIGGLAGTSGALISSSYATGNVVGDASSYRLGGLVADSSAAVTGSYSTGSVACTGTCGYVGGLVGESGGPITNSYATGAVSSGDYPDIGGLTGRNYNTISGSHATGSVTAGAYVYAGGLTGNSFGAITNSYASGNVTAGSNSNAGGLAGTNSAAISSSYATGPVNNPGGAYSGGLVGESYSGGTIGNSYASGNVTGGHDIGGLIGGSADAITSSYASGAVAADGSTASAGGLAGVSSAPISGSNASGAVTCGVAYCNVGGLVGTTSTGGTISDSFATGDVSGGTGAIWATSVGGLVGVSNDAITNSYETGTVSNGDQSVIGGLVGLNNSSIATSYALGSVTAGNTADAGGLVGDQNGSLTDTYARGSVTAANPYSSAGGLVGYLETNATITTSYSSGAVGGTTGGAGFLGSNGGGTVTNSYWDDQASGFPGSGGSAGITGLTTAQLQSGNMPVGFNAVHQVWVAPAGLYPYFGWQGPVVTIGGTAYNGLTAIASAGVNVLSKGFLLGRVTTNSSGFYSISEPQNMTNGGVLTYLTSNGTANTFSDGAGSNGFTDMNLYSGTVNLLSSSYTSVSALNAALASTLASNSGANFLFTVPGGQLTTSAGTSVRIAASAPNFTVDQPLRVTGSILINAASDLTIAAGKEFGAGSGSNITLVTGGAFTNHAGANALTVSGGGQWLVYSRNPANDVTGGLIPAFKQYNATYGMATPAQPGNGLLYTLAPVVTASLDGSVSKTYDGTTTATLFASNLASTGTIAGDTVILTAPSVTYGSANVGSGISITASGLSIASALNGSIRVYGYQLAGNSLIADIGTINPATLTYIATPTSRTYGTSNPVFGGTITGFVAGQTLPSATTGTAVFTSAAGATSTTGSYAIDGSGLTADHGNYVFVQAGLNGNALTVTAASAPTPTPTPTPTPKPSPTPTPAPTVLTFAIGTATGLQNSKPIFAAAYTGAAVQGLDITSILSGLTFTITPSLSGPGTYTITAVGTAPAGYALKIAPATLTIIGNSAAILPTEAPVIPPVVPEVLPNSGGNEAASLLQPLNSVGLFQVNVTGNGSSFGASFIGFGSQQAPLAQSVFFGTNDKKDTYSAGAKP